MKKQEILSLKEELKCTKTITLQQHISALNGIIHDRDVSKKMWFWTDNGNSATRRSKEKYYYRDTKIKLGKHKLYYHRDISMSRKNVYVNEELEFDGDDITVKDLKKMIDAFADIINRRNNK